LRWRLVKTRFSSAMPNGERRCASRLAKGERGIWQRRYWEHLIRNDDDFGRHVDYVHFNPVKHGYVSQAIDWPHSSVHRFVADGRLPANWGFSADDRAGFGESR
jgi:putative transposase